MEKIAVRRCHTCGDELAPLEPFLAWYRPAVRFSRYWCMTCAHAHVGYDIQGHAVLIPLAWREDDEADSVAEGGSEVNPERSEP